MTTAPSAAPALLPLERDTTGPFAGIVTMRLDQSPSPMVVLDHDLIRRIEATLRENRLSLLTRVLRPFARMR